MKKVIIGIAVIALAVFGGVLLSYSNDSVDISTQDTGSIDSGPHIAATIFPLYDIARVVAGEDAHVSLMLAPGASPHTFDPQPRIIQELEGIERILAIGHGLDAWTTQIAEALDAPVLAVDTGIDVVDNQDQHEDHGHDDEHEDESSQKHDHNHGPTDPHYWLSIENAQIIATTVADILTELDPDQGQAYSERASAYVQQLQLLDQELQEDLSALENRNIVTMHDAWTYFAESFDIDIVGTFEPAAGTNPSPRYLQELQEVVIEHNVSVMFSEPQLSIDSIRMFADDLDLHIAVLDPLGGVEGRESYIDLIRFNVDAVVDTIGQ